MRSLWALVALSVWQLAGVSQLQQWSQPQQKV
jgi:hypothetical protein